MALAATARSRRISSGDNTVAPPLDCAAIRAAIVRVYRQHNPERLGSIDKLLAQHMGREGELLRKILDKYEGGGRRAASRPSGPGNLPPVVQRSVVEQLPYELVANCLRFLHSASDAGRCAGVCRVWCDVIGGNCALWQRLYVEAWPGRLVGRVRR